MAGKKRLWTAVALLLIGGGLALHLAYRRSSEATLGKAFRSSPGVHFKLKPILKASEDNIAFNVGDMFQGQLVVENRSDHPIVLLKQGGGPSGSWLKMRNARTGEFLAPADRDSDRLDQESLEFRDGIETAYTIEAGKDLTFSLPEVDLRMDQDNENLEIVSRAENWTRRIRPGSYEVWCEIPVRRRDGPLPALVSEKASLSIAAMR